MACNPQYLNPNGTAWDLKHYNCSQDCVLPPYCNAANRTNGTQGGDGQITCYCTRSQLSVGKMDLRQPAQAGKSPPDRCGFGFKMLQAGRCLQGKVLQTIWGSNQEQLAGKCCDACFAFPLGNCSGYTLRSVPANSSSSAPLFSCDCYGPGATTSQTNTGGECFLSAERDALPGGSWNWEVDLGGAWFSTPATGECRPGQLPKGDKGCTWSKLEERPDGIVFVEAECVLAAIDAVVIGANQDCFSGCSSPMRGVQGHSECFWRCYWLTVGGGGSAPLVQPADLVRDFEATFAPEGCPRIHPQP